MKPNFEAIKAASEGSSGSAIQQSGLYEVQIVKAYINTREGTQSKTLNLRVKPKDSDSQKVFFIRQTNNDGKENFEKILLDKLLVVCGIEEVKRLIPTKFKYKEKEYFEDCIQELENKQVIIQIKQEFSKWNGQIQERFRVINFFRVDDKATAIEIVEQKDFGKKYESLDETYVKSPSYKDGVTEQEAKAYIDARITSSGNGSTSQTAVKESDEIPF